MRRAATSLVGHIWTHAAQHHSITSSGESAESLGGRQSEPSRHHDRDRWAVARDAGLSRPSTPDPGVKIFGGDVFPPGPVYPLRSQTPFNPDPRRGRLLPLVLLSNRVGALAARAWTMEGSMRVWILMRNVWDGRGSSTDVVDEVFSSEIAAERARREKEKAVKDQVDPDRFTIEGPFEVGG
jgi:hypothetical protein